MSGGLEALEERARRLVESGVLNWPGPARMALFVSRGGRAMSPETAKDCVDAAFSTPRPALELELVDEDGRGWPAAWLAMEYGVRRAEWGGRGLRLTYRCRSAPAPERAERLAALRAEARAEFVLDGPPGDPAFFAAPRALARVGRRARDPEGWVDALGRAGVRGVTWVRDGAAPAAFASFRARAFARAIETHETSDLRDEHAVAMLSGRTWEVPGLDLFETLAFDAEGRVFSSEEGLAAAERGDESFTLGEASAFRFQDLPALPLVRALAASSVSAGQPLCAGCPYRRWCVIAPSAHFRDQGTLAGRLPDSPSCREHIALFDALMARKSDEICLKALDKWGVDI